jgi:hypothetical protein
MRMSFVVVVLFVSMLFWQFIEYQANASLGEVVERKALPMDVLYETMEARTYLNSIRKLMKMQRLAENKQLKSAAQAHADYLVLNDESAHEEIMAHKNFTGITPVERAFHAGYASSQLSENLSTKNHNARTSVDGLLSAIYHRFGFLNPSIDQIGVGVTQDMKDIDKSAFVYLMGNSELNQLCTGSSFSGSGKYIYKVCKESDHRIQEREFYRSLQYSKQNNPKIILYPYDGEEEVPPAFYSEIPDPLPDHEVSGFPISVEFNDYFFKNVTLHSFRLYVEGGEEVGDIRLMDKHSDPHQKFTANQYALFPLQRLEYNQEYRAEISYTSKGKKETLIWYFHTRKPTEEFHLITQKEETISIDHGKSHIVYFRPHDPHDIIKNIQFPVDIDITFLDNNTIKLTLMSDEIDEFDITSDTRRLHIEVK